MRSKGIVLLFICFFAVQTYGQRTDIIVLKNGDRITCEITGMDRGVLFAKVDYIDGLLEIDWRQVAKLESKRLFIVKTENGLVHEGTISTAPLDADKVVKIELKVDPATNVELKTADVVTIDTSSQSFRKRFNGYLIAGMSYTKGNAYREYNLRGLIEYPRERWGFQADISSNLSASNGIRTTTRNELRTSVDRQLGRNNYFLRVGAGFLQSTEQGISLQKTFGVGVGYRFINSNRAKVSLIGGMGWQRTNYDLPDLSGASQNTTAALIGTDIKFFKFKKAGLDLYAGVMPSVSEPGRIFSRLNQTIYYKIFPRLTLNISFYGSWDNRPPFGLPGSDYGTTTGLGWTFGSK